MKKLVALLATTFMFVSLMPIAQVYAEEPVMSFRGGAIRYDNNVEIDGVACFANFLSVVTGKLIAVLYNDSGDMVDTKFIGTVNTDSSATLNSVVLTGEGDVVKLLFWDGMENAQPYVSSIPVESMVLRWEAGDGKDGCIEQGIELAWNYSGIGGDFTSYSDLQKDGADDEWVLRHGGGNGKINSAFKITDSRFYPENALITHIKITITARNGGGNLHYSAIGNSDLNFGEWFSANGTDWSTKVYNIRKAYILSDANCHLRFNGGPIDIKSITIEPISVLNNPKAVSWKAGNPDTGGNLDNGLKLVYNKDDGTTLVERAINSAGQPINDDWGVRTYVDSGDHKVRCVYFSISDQYKESFTSDGKYRIIITATSDVPGNTHKEGGNLQYAEIGDNYKNIEEWWNANGKTPWETRIYKEITNVNFIEGNDGFSFRFVCEGEPNDGKFGIYIKSVTVLRVD